MKRFLSILIIAFIFTISSISYNFATDLTLDEAIQKALKNNPYILIAKDRVRQAELKVEEAKKILTPSISIHGGYNVITNKEGLGFQISQDLDRLLGGNRREKTSVRLELNIAQRELILTEQRITKEVTDAYYNLKILKDNLKLKEEILESAKKSLEFAKAQFNLGKISLDSLLSGQKEVRGADVELKKAECELKKAELNLSQLIGETK